MRLYLTALNPTDAVLDGFLPAAARLGLPVTVLTDQPDRWPSGPARITGCAVHDPVQVVEVVRRGEPPVALLSNSDHLQTATAVAATRLGLPSKDSRVTRRTKDKFLTRATLADAGLDRVAVATLGPDTDPTEVVGTVPFPAVVKPRKGVASEDVYLVADVTELATRVRQIRAGRPGQDLIVEEYLDGDLHTLETLGDDVSRVVTGGWRTSLGPPPTFAEEALDWAPVLPPPLLADLHAQLDTLGVRFGAAHTEFVRQGDRARIIEVNYRLIGDGMDLIMAELLAAPLFEYVIRLHAGEPLAALPLPDPTVVPRSARVEYVCAQRSGTLTAAPGVLRHDRDGIRLGCRPLRAVGVTAARTGTNRDYLAVLHAIGPDAASTRAALDEFRSAQRWDIG